MIIVIYKFVKRVLHSVEPTKKDMALEFSQKAASQDILEFYCYGEVQHFALNRNKDYYFGSDCNLDFVLYSSEMSASIYPLVAVLSYDEYGWFLQLYNNVKHPIKEIKLNEKVNVFFVKGHRFDLLREVPREKVQFKIEVN